jgi:hypothetical protein
MPHRDRQPPTPADEGQLRRSLQDRRLADQLRQNLLRRKIQSRARDGQATEGQGQTAHRRPKLDRGSDVE